MEPELLVMGTDNHYHQIRTDKDFLQQRADEIRDTKNDGRELEFLVDSDLRIDPKTLYRFGIAKRIPGANKGNETIIDCLDNLFQNVKEYAKLYNASFALVHDLQAEDKNRCKQASVMVQLYL